MTTLAPFEKLPPHDIEAEEACIGAALVSSEAVDALDFEWPLYVFDVGRPSLDTLVSEVRRQCVQRGVQVLLLDHMHHVRVPGITETTAALNEVSAATKGIAVNQGICVVQVAHINREAAKTGWVDLRSAKGSSAIEQDSNVVLALNEIIRDENGEMLKDAYGKDRGPTRREADEFKVKNGYMLHYLSVEKNRNGGQGGLERWLSWNNGGRYVPVGGAM